MSQKTKTIRGIPQTTLRRLRYTPTYFFLIWRWTFWIYAFVWIMVLPTGPTPLLLALLGITFIQSLLATLYTPVFKIYFPGIPLKSKKNKTEQDSARRDRSVIDILWKRNSPQALAVDEDAEIIPPRNSSLWRWFTILPVRFLINLCCGICLSLSWWFSGCHWIRSIRCARVVLSPTNGTSAVYTTSTRTARLNT